MRWGQGCRLAGWVVALATGAAAGCASGPHPAAPDQARLANVLTFVSRAERENVDRDWEAARRARAARAEHADAVRAIAAHDTERAWRSLMQAEADAELSYALARRTNALVAADRASSLLARARAGDPVALGPRELPHVRRGPQGDPNWPPPPHYDPWELRDRPELQSELERRAVARPVEPARAPARSAAADVEGGAR